MGFKAFLGYLLIGLGPGPALFFKYIAPKPLLLLLFLTGCFVWLTVLMFIAIIWLWVLPADGRKYLYFLVVLTAVVVEEAIRYPLYLLIEKVSLSNLASRWGRRCNLCNTVCISPSGHQAVEQVCAANWVLCIVYQGLHSCSCCDRIRASYCACHALLRRAALSGP